MNGDESFALGAAFVAANRSKSFRPRTVAMIDAHPFAIGVRLAHLDAAPAAAAAAGDADAAAPGKPWSKRSSLFKVYNALDSVKRISFSAARDLRATLFYENATAGSPALPAGTARVLALYNVTGLDALMANATVAARGVPKVHISFVLDHNGIATVLRAEATQEEEERGGRREVPPRAGGAAGGYAGQRRSASAVPRAPSGTSTSAERGAHLPDGALPGRRELHEGRDRAEHHGPKLGQWPPPPSRGGEEEQDVPLRMRGLVLDVSCDAVASLVLLLAGLWPIPS
jgi:hypothetical protein